MNGNVNESENTQVVSLKLKSLPIVSDLTNNQYLYFFHTQPNLSSLSVLKKYDLIARISSSLHVCYPNKNIACLDVKKG